MNGIAPGHASHESQPRFIRQVACDGLNPIDIAIQAQASQLCSVPVSCAWRRAFCDYCFDTSICGTYNPRHSFMQGSGVWGYCCPLGPGKGAYGVGAAHRGRMEGDAVVKHNGNGYEQFRVRQILEAFTIRPTPKTGRGNANAMHSLIHTASP